MSADGIFIQDTRGKWHPVVLDHERQIADFLSERLPEIPDAHPRDSENLAAWNSPRCHPARLPTPNYPDAPELIPGDIYWPTGATRWAVAEFLIDRTTAQAMASRPVPEGGISQEPGPDWSSPYVSVLVRSGSVSATFRMYPVEPAPIHWSGSLYLLRLVDDRYFWRDRVHAVGAIENDQANPSVVWTRLLLSVRASLFPFREPWPLVIEPCIPPEYLHPDLGKLAQYERVPAADLLDALAWSVNRRVVIQPGEEVIYLRSAAAELPVVASNFGVPGPHVISAGGTRRETPLPARLAMRFDFQPTIPAAWHSAVSDVPDNPISSDDVGMPLAALLAEATGPRDVGGQAGVFSAARAYGTSGVPANAAELQTLADIYTAEWYGWRRAQYDAAFSGLKPWRLTGFDDFLLWRLGVEVCDSRKISIGDPGRETKEPEVVRIITSRVRSLSHHVEQRYQWSTHQTTTTTPEPSPCSGRCRWTWSESDQFWVLDSDECSDSPATTTESPGETTSTTTTTEHPCATTTTTTTTAGPVIPEGCRCLYPSFCGTSDGQCTYTYCASGEVWESIECTSTTTTIEPCDCDTTTTAGGCSDGCVWKVSPLGGPWVLLANHCSDSCPCPFPTDPAEPCGVVNTPCVPTTLPPPYCLGNCTWVWIEETQVWSLANNGCNFFRSVCVCTEPSEPGDNCAVLTLPCQSPTGVTREPCADCYDGTTTSTTAGPCPGQCIWSWNTGTSQWTEISSGCGEGCFCQFPAFDGVDECSTVATNCFGDPPPTTTTTTSTTTTTTSTTTTTTSTTTTTTTTTSTTTTTPPPCEPCGQCSCTYQYLDNEWVLQETQCDATGDFGFDWNCEQVLGPGTQGDCECTDCVVVDGPCTTTTETTTTTTTTTTTAEPCTGECEWFRDITQWDKVSDTCSEGCMCFDPDFPGEFGNSAFTPCIPS